MRRLLAGDFVDVPQHGATVRADQRRSGAGFAILFPVDVFDAAVIGEGASDGAERFAGAFQRPGAAGVGEDAEVADAVQPFRQDVKQEAPDELGGRDPVVPGQALDLEQVGALCGLGQIGDAQLLDHALAKRAAPRPVERFSGHHRSPRS